MKSYHVAFVQGDRRLQFVTKEGKRRPLLLTEVPDVVERITKDYPELKNLFVLEATDYDKA